MARRSDRVVIGAVGMLVGLAVMMAGLSSSRNLAAAPRSLAGHNVHAATQCIGGAPLVNRIAATAGARQGRLRDALKVKSMEALMDGENPMPSQTVSQMATFKGYHSDLYFNDNTYEPIRKMILGVAKLTAVVGCTLGPKGRNVVVQRRVGTRPRIINDGVSIAKEVHLEDDLEEIGSQLVLEASERTNAEAGDGTTTAIVLSNALIQEGLKRVVSGVNAMQIYRGMEKTTKKLVEYLENEVAIKVIDDQIEDVATISASGRRDIGVMIAKALKAVGRLGMITLEEGRNVDDWLETQQGMFVDECGYINPKLINNPEDGIVQYEKARVVIVDGDVNTLEEIIPVMEIAFEKDEPVFIVAHKFAKEVENFLVLNQQRAGLKVAAVTAPAFGDLRSNILEDIAILTGATVVGEETDLGLSLSSATEKVMGYAELVEVGKEGCLIQGPNSTKEAVDARVQQLVEKRDRSDAAGNPFYERDKFNRRIAKLKGGVAVIYVGAMTELELRDRKLRYDDALCAIRAALDEGIVAGGATAYVRLADKVDEIAKDLNSEEVKGADILKKALEYPLLQVSRNAGVHGPLVVANVRDGQESDPLFGWNAATDEYGNMVEMGIIEPAKVIRCALENSVSVAKTFLLTEGVVVQHYLGEKPKEAEVGEIQM